MCGPSQQEKNLSQEQADMYQKMNDAYTTTFGQNQAITGALTKTFTPILAAGPGQEGFSQGEKDALQTGATESTATDYANANRTTSQALAARGGGNAFLPSGVTTQLNANNATGAAGELASEENKNKLADYSQGYQNWQTAANVLGSTASLLNPNAAGSTALSAGSEAFGSANTIQQQQDSGWKLAAGALGSVAGAAAGNLNFSSGKGWSLGSQ